MSPNRLPARAAMLGLIVASVCNCSSPYTNAAATYSKASGASTQALAGVPASVAGLCHTEAHLAYLQARLKGGAVLAGDFYGTALATPTLHWKEFCAEIEKTGPLFATGVTALSTYGVALGNLAGAGDPSNGIDLSSLSTSATSIAGSLGGQSISGVIQPVGGLVQSLSNLVLAAHVDHKLRGYVTRADPIVQQLIASLLKYLDTVQSSLESADATLLSEVKNLADHNITPDPTKSDALKVLQFYQIAAAMDSDARQTRSGVDAYRSVLSQMKDAHTQLAKADQTDVEADVSKALGTIITLITQIQTLQTSIASIPR